MAHITSLQRGLEILRLLNDRGVSQIKHLHQLTGLPKPTLVRMLDTLIDAGYAIRGDTGGYRVSAKVLALANGFDAEGNLLNIAKPVLDVFREEHIWPSDLAIFDRDAMVIMDTGRHPGTLSLNRTPGSRLPVLNTALGRAYLAFAPDEVCQRALERLCPDAKQAEKTNRLLGEVREKGYAVSDKEYLSTTRAVSVPICVHETSVASLNMMTVAKAMTMTKAEKTFVPLLRSVARLIESRLAQNSS